jgi:hypothetical protein
LLKYVDKQYLHSTTSVTTTSTSLVDDDEASLTFSLTEERVVLILYAACNYHGSTEYHAGKKLAINVDGDDVATIHTSPCISNYANGGVVVYVGVLASGSHTVKGRFASNVADQTVTIDDRSLLAVIFEGTSEDFRFTRSTTETYKKMTCYQEYFEDDPEASFTFTPKTACVALILYSICNYHGALQWAVGKRIKIVVDGVAQQPIGHGSSPYADNYADSEFVCALKRLSAEEHTIKGQRNINLGTSGDATISERQFGVLLLPWQYQADYVEQSVEETFGCGPASLGDPAMAFVTGSTLSDDPNATVTRKIETNHYTLTIYCACKAGGDVESSAYGKKVSVNINGVDYGLNAKSPFHSKYANSPAVFSDVITLSSGTHTVKGRFANNVADQTARVDNRVLAVLWMAETIFEVTQQNLQMMHGGL